MKTVSFVHFRCGSMTSSWPLFGVSFQIIALLHLTYYKITHHHSWTKRFSPPNPVTRPHHFAEDLGIPAWHFLQGFQRHQAQLRRQKLHQQGLRRFLGGQPGSHSEMEWLGFGGKKWGSMFFWVFFVNGKVLGILSSSAPRKKTWDCYFLTVQVFPTTSLAALKMYGCISCSWKWGYLIQLCLLDRIWKDLPQLFQLGGRLNSAIQWSSLVEISHPLRFFFWNIVTEATHMFHRKGTMKKVTFMYIYYHILIKLTVVPMKDLQTKHPPMGGV